ncbi:MAG: type VII secretion protein EssC [Clostridiales Family XIII bacterium]|nr:type VII secretion protein EssC [Clostridiales Family XIII bacterium]
MKKRDYKILLVNRQLYREIELPADVLSLRVGTEGECDVRIRKEYFFASFELLFLWENDCWNVRCMGDAAVSSGDLRMLKLPLQHGDSISLKYASSGGDLMTMDFFLDFDRGNKLYDRKIDLSDTDVIHIGNADHCEIFCADDYLRGDFLTLTSRGGLVAVSDEQTKYGVFVNGARITGSKTLGDRDFFSLGEFSFYYKQGFLYCSHLARIDESALSVDDISEQRSALDYPMFNRGSRAKPVLPDDKLNLLDPPSKPEKNKTNIIITLLPILVMLVMVVMMRSLMSGTMGNYIWFSVAMMSVGAMTSVFSVFSGKGDFKRKTKERKEKYEEYIKNKKKDYQEIRDYELQLLNDLYPDSEAEYRAVFDFSDALFDRMPEDEDYLVVRVGEGIREAIRVIDYKKKETIETDDDLANVPEQIAEEFRQIEKAPITIDLKTSNAVGVVGEEYMGYSILKNLAIDIATRHYYRDVSLFFIFNEKHAPLFQWIRLLPHLNNENLGRRNIACDDDSRIGLFEYLYKELSNRSSSKEKGQDFVIFVFDDEGFKQHPLSKFVSGAAELNATFFFFEANKELLPQYCDQIVTIFDEENAEVMECADRTIRSAFTYTAIEDEKAEQIVTRLAPVYCEEISLEKSLTKNISLFELLNIFSVDDLNLEQRWARSQVVRSMAAPLGVRTKNDIVYLDLHEKAHGPHGLVAGTTGSGKSEILQSYILSATTLFHPYDISFVIIDFKGGGMAGQFKDLPHLVGTITNIDGREIERSLRSIKAELRRRQEIFAATEVNQIDRYISLYKKGEAPTPLPHLVIIVDEFAELKAEQPEFMKELISAARIGRSLGVHLILATQKPSGQVNEQIWSNSRFKLCLKVQTPEDSNEMLKSPLASEITEPGRAYFQVGNNEIFELFQSAYSGSPEHLDDKGKVSKEYAFSMLDLAGRKKPVFSYKPEHSGEEQRTQLAAIISHVQEFCASRGIEKLPDICLPPLPDIVDYDDEANVFERTLDMEVGIGIFDDPDNQRQGLATLEVASGNTLIIGSSQYGKTNMLQSIIRSLAANYTPAELSIYIIDFASMVLKNFEKLDHVGGVVTASEDEKLKNLFKLLDEEVVVRKEKLIAAGVSSFAAYKEAGMEDLPQIVVIVDNLTVLKELYLNDDDPLLVFAREGIAVGISIIVANSLISGLGYRYLANFAHRFAFHCNDSQDYGAVFDHCRMEPSEKPGRCLLEIDKTFFEAQTFLAFQGEREIDRVKAMHAFVEECNEKHAGKPARRIPVVPQHLTMEYLDANFLLKPKPYTVPFGLDYDTVDPVEIDFSEIGQLGLVGKSPQDRLGLALHIAGRLLEDAAQHPIEVAVVDDLSKPLLSLKEHEQVKYMLTTEAAIEVVQDWKLVLSKRYDKLMEENNPSFEAEPLLLLIFNNADAIGDISGNVGVMEDYTAIVTRLKKMKVAVVFANIDNTNLSFGVPEMLRRLKERQQFIYFGNYGDVKVMDVSLNHVRRFRKAAESGDAFWFDETEVYRVKTVQQEE